MVSFDLSGAVEPGDALPGVCITPASARKPRRYVALEPMNLEMPVPA